MARLLLCQRIFLLWTLLVIEASTFSSTTTRRAITSWKEQRFYDGRSVNYSFVPLRSSNSLSARRSIINSRRINASNTSLWSSIKNNENQKQKEAVTAADIRAAPSVWNPMGRKVMAGLASLGVLETAYLTYAKLTTSGSESLSKLCGALSDNVAGGSTSSSCGSVLDSSYASVGGIPLSLIGMCAYMLVLGLSVYPLIVNDNHTTQQQQQQIDNRPSDNNDDDKLNRLSLLTMTTTMGVTSAFLIYIILAVLKSNCIFCYASATLSATLAAIAWFGGAGEGLMTIDNSDNKSNGPDRTLVLQGLGSILSVLILTAGIYINNQNVSNAANDNIRLFQTALNSGATNTASSSLTLSMSLPSWTKTSTTEVPTIPEEGYSPPLISTTSSERALQLSDELKVLHTRFFGAYWCSHCYDQKQTMGKEAMAQIEYIECAKDGYQSQNALCKETKIPGYPTWEIAGQLFPGEQSLDELEDIIRDIQKQTSK